MALQQGTGYRDPAKAMTIKALQERQKLAATAAQAATANVGSITADPLSGVSYLANALSGGVQQGRADRQEADARAQLSSIMAGIDPEKGATMQQIAQMQQLDPDFANKEYERAMAERAAVRTREDQQAHDAAQQAALFGQQDKTQAALFGHEDTSREDTQAAAAQLAADNDRRKAAEDVLADQRADENAKEAAKTELAKLDYTAKLDADKKQSDLAAENANIGPQIEARKAAAQKLGLVEGTPEYNEFTATGDWPSKGTTIVNDMGQTSKFAQKSDDLAAERLGKVVEEGAAAGPFIGQLRIIADLGKNIGTGKGAQIVQQLGPYADMFGIKLDGLDEGQAYNAIVDKLAPNMRVVGAGSSSDFDARQFLSSLPSLGRTEAGNKIINDTFEALGQHKMAAAEIAAKAQRQEIPWTEAEAQIRALPNPYDTFKKMQGAPDKAPDDTGTGGAPAFDPAVDQEGDTGTDDAGKKWVVRNGTWVPQ